jgi:hypothetical protein
MHIFALLMPAVGALIPVAAGVFLYRLGRGYQQKYRLIGQTPVGPVGKIAPGFVHVRGTVACAEPLTSPLTQSPCCYYRTTIERLTRSSQGAASFTTIYSEPGAKAFYLDDGTGKVLVDPVGADYDVPQVFSTHLRNDTPGLTLAVIDPAVANGMPPEQRLRDFVGQHASDQQGRVHVVGNPALEQRIADAMAAESTTFRLTEHCLFDKQTCSVLGTSDVNGGATNGAATRIQKGTTSPTFVITNRSDQQEASRWRMRALGFMGGGIALIGLGAIGLLSAVLMAV